MTRFNLEGTTEEIQTCDLCGRMDLQKTVIIGWLDDDGNKVSQNHYGTTCIYYAMQFAVVDGYDWKKAIKEAERSQRANRRIRLGEAIDTLTHPRISPGAAAFMDGFRGRNVDITVANWIDDIEVFRHEFAEKGGVQGMHKFFKDEEVEQAIANGQAYLSQ